MEDNKYLSKLTYFIVVAIIIVSLIIIYTFIFHKDSNVVNQDEVLKYNIVFDLNGADNVEYNRISCTVSEEGCQVVLPTARRENGRVLGYSINPNDKEPKYLIGEKLSLSGNMHLYVISLKENNLIIEASNLDYVEKNRLSCIVYNKEESCMVTIPPFNKIGYELRGYSTSPSSLSGFVFPYEKYKISKDVIIYPIYNTQNHLSKINVLKTMNIGKSIVEVENGCEENIYNNYIKYLNEINRRMSFLGIGSKITFMVDDSFNQIWGNGYVGMNYGPRNIKALDVRCSSKVQNDYYGTIVHEMAHTWDFYYASIKGSNITSQSDVINLYNKYLKATNRPFRDYSYTSIYEFFADSIRYYYFKYSIASSVYNSFNYPSDIKNVVEKYICIAKNDYNEEKCL